MEVAPVKRRNSSKRDFLVVFKEMESVGPTSKEEARHPEVRGPRRKREREKMVALERELVSTRESLRSLIGEHETVQSEMKSAHEEIVSSNEELQSTNEELIQRRTPHFKQ